MDDFPRQTDDPSDRRRRGVSQEVDSYASIKAQRGHRRIVSNTAMDLHKVLGNSVPLDPPTRPSLQVAKAETRPEPLTPDSLGGSGGEEMQGDSVNERDSIEDKVQIPVKMQDLEEVETNPRAKRPGNGFTGMLDAAIIYFAEDRPVRPVVSSNYSVQEEALNLRTAITGLKQRLVELESENEGLNRANQKLSAQHEHYSRHINQLNTKLSDLQQQAEAPAFPQAIHSDDSLEESEPIPQSRVRLEDLPTATSSSRPGSSYLPQEIPERRYRPQKPKPPVKGKVKVNSAIYFS